MKWLVLGGLTLFAAVALADYNVQDHGTHYQNASTGLRTNSTGSIMVDGSSTGPESQVSGWIALINDTTAVGMADSSAVQTQYANYIIHGLLIRSTPPAGAALPFTRVALSIRTHLNELADSVSTAPVAFRRGNGAQTTAGDSLTYGRATAPTSVVEEDEEIIVNLIRADAGATKWATGVQKYIPVMTANGGPVRLPNFSVRERILSSSGTTGNTVTVYAYCTMLR